MYKHAVDMQFVKTFLLTYQSFTTPESLLMKLIERYNVIRPVGMPMKNFSMFRTTIQVNNCFSINTCVYQ